MRSRPWTAKDAPAHNAALKGKAKLSKLWADTANGTLQSELAAGKKQADAEGAAIATANKAVGKKLSAKSRGEPHGDSGKPRAPTRGVGRPVRTGHPVRRVTAVPGVTRAINPWDQRRENLTPLSHLR
jgi:hypothetical protein